VAICFSLPALFSVMNGQDTPLLLLWMTLASVLSGRGRFFAAGLALAMCQTKFHLFLPLWLILLSGRRWRWLGGMAAGNVLLVAVSCTIAGWRWPLDYLASINRDIVSPGAGHMPTLYYVLASVGFPEWWWTGPAVCIAAAAWYAGRRLSVETGLAIAPALILPFLKHTSTFDALLLLPLLMMSVASGSTPARLCALALLSPIPWLACLGGYPWSTAAPVLVLFLIGSTFRRRGLQHEPRG